MLLVLLLLFPVPGWLRPRQPLGLGSASASPGFMVAGELSCEGRGRTWLWHCQNLPLPRFFNLPSVSRRGQEEPRSSHCYSSLYPGSSIPGLVRRTKKTGRGRGQATVTPAVFSVHKRGQKSSTKKERR
ncbi:hypothetical protein DPEC_G00179100 [Dallia pectoralis]|uniref:Uncharacterized protein n=1 Tax=Dallia pectoralis TaxID=75939 RepID=A0ACC2GFV9_DALPE|nr:hypothetical protein DPEC_G00179100 [Dallia pectoralis]